MVEVLFTLSFKRRLKTLSKRYRQIQIDIQPILDQLQAGKLIYAKSDQADVSLDEIEDAIKKI